ncbi:hypothetical protein [Arthrobacter sp. NPDC058127]|uniref:hypothetical protein n=1 Tax=Arthrobacter sp. NPDC058127 TaxID=3346351 RepID=UPI0036E56544
MLQKKTRQVITAGLGAASLLIAAPPAHAGCNVQGCEGGGHVLYPPSIGTAVSGVPGGPITATAAWSPHPANVVQGFIATGYRVLAKRLVPYFDTNTNTTKWIIVGTTTSAVQPAEARTLSMTLPETGTYAFYVQEMDRYGTSSYSTSYSAGSNLVKGQ